jgi:hypothetical protein
MAIRTGLGTTTSDQKSAGSFAQNLKTPPKNNQSSTPFGISSKDKVVEVHRGPPATEREPIPAPPEKIGFSLNQFFGEIFGRGSSHQGLYKQSLYLVEILPHPGSTFLTSVIGDSKKLSMLCNSASLPGAQVLSSDHRRQNYGTFDRRPFGIQVTDIPITFFVDNGGYILTFFNEWFNNIINYNFAMGEHAASGTNQQLFEVNYRQHYLCTIKIHTFDHTGKEILSYELSEAFPIQMGDITVAWSENDSFSVLPIQFTFRTYRTSRQQSPVLRLSGNSINPEVKKQIQGDPAVAFGISPIDARDTLSQISRPTIASLGNI